jgi:hypothetical protein
MRTGSVSAQSTTVPPDAWSLPASACNASSPALLM